MNPDEIKLIEYSIALPLALKLFTLDRKQFENLYATNAYLDLFDTIIEQIKYDIVSVKEKLFHKYHIIVQEHEGNRYKVIQYNKSQFISYTSDEVKNMTTNVMNEYLQGSKVLTLKKKSRVWKQLNMQPPEVDLDIFGDK